jgi:hypothetical protein
LAAEVPVEVLAVGAAAAGEDLVVVVLAGAAREGNGSCGVFFEQYVTKLAAIKPEISLCRIAFRN